MDLEFRHLSEINCSEIIALNTNPLVRRNMPLAREKLGEKECLEWVAGKEKQWEENAYGPWAFLVDGKFAGWGGLQYENGDADLGLVLHPEYRGLGKILYDEKSRCFAAGFRSGTNMKSEIYAPGRMEWRSWLSENHAKAEEAWLVYYKKHTGKPCIAYVDSVEEALCFGWIDGLKRRIDDEKYAYRFTPRRAGSKWSPLNIELANKMIAQGKMTKAGLAAFNQRVSYDKEVLKPRNAKGIPLTPEIRSGLMANKKAWKNFNNLAPSHRKQYVGWLRSAKKPETREKRLREAIELLEKNEKLGMK